MGDRSFCGCLTSGEPCQDAADCCNVAAGCVNWPLTDPGVTHCGPEACLPDGDTRCTQNSDCCNGDCSYDPGLATWFCGCVPTGDLCSTAADCCNTGGGCTLWPSDDQTHCGPPACVPEGGTCATNADCCATAPYCVDLGDGNGPVCATTQPCVPVGGPCSASSDCCQTPPAYCFDLGDGAKCYEDQQ